MYKIYFEDRLIVIGSEKNTESKNNNIKFIRYKNKKSFYKALKEFKKDTNIQKLVVQTKKIKKVFKRLKKKFKQINAAGGLVFNTHGNVLMIKRNGVWDLPKGKIEKGEQRPEAAIREVEEECGVSRLVIEGKIGRTYHTYVFREKNMFKTTHWFLMKYSANEKLVPQTEEDITEVMWKTPEEIKEIIPNTYKSLVDILKEV
ncbi:MAG: NUDIX hydrolase [Bacteroidetes bacterium]|nr:MAG: NUDIX hydrolase [Bacteroidota bacterium]